MTGRVHVVDDDEAIRDALSWLLESNGMEVCCWNSAEHFLSGLSGTVPADGAFSGCLILDIRMGGMSGLELFDHLSTLRFTLPVIFLTGHGDVPMAVNALKKGAFDFFEKPFDNEALIARIREAMTIDAETKAIEAERNHTACRLNALSERERQVMERVLDGRLNKVIADELSISMRTVEVHRSRVFEKMGVKSAVELAQLLKTIHR